MVSSPSPKMPSQALEGIPVRGIARVANAALDSVLAYNAKPAEDRKRPHYYDPGSRAGKALRKKEEEEEAELEVERKKEAIIAAERAQYLKLNPPPPPGGRRLGSAPPDVIRPAHES